jgi:hypothetical protein
MAQTPPAEVAALAEAPTGGSPASGPAPRIMVRTKPAELLMTSGLPDFRPIRGTALQYAADTDSQLFFHTAGREAYLLLSGRWFKAKSLEGPWTHVAPRDLPGDFARIPPGSAQAVVLASVPDTPQAELAGLANSVPTTATVSRRDARFRFPTMASRSSNQSRARELRRQRPLPVILAGDIYYASTTACGLRPGSRRSVAGGHGGAGGDLHDSAQLARLLRDVRQYLSVDG